MIGGLVGGSLTFPSSEEWLQNVTTRPGGGGGAGRAASLWVYSISHS